MLRRALLCGLIGMIAAVAGATGATDAIAAAPDHTPVHPDSPPLPHVTGPIAVTPKSWPWASAAHAAGPIDLGSLGYVEEEYFISGRARIYAWPALDRLESFAEGPYVTRILVRRPASAARFSGTILVEPLNPSLRYDLPLVWGDAHEHLVRHGDIWVGVTVKPVAIQSLKEFDPGRYASLGFPNPLPPDRTCPQSQLAMPRGGLPPESSPATENGMIWDVLSQTGALLKSRSPANPLRGFAVRRLYMVGDSQSGAFVLTYANAIHPFVRTAAGGPLYDGYLATVSTAPSTPISQCAAPVPRDDPRHAIQPRGVPIITIVSESETGSLHRRPDSDRAPDLFRGYEVAGASHIHAGDGQGDPSAADAARTAGAKFDTSAACVQHDASANDVPIGAIIDGALVNLDRWTRDGMPPPRGEPIRLAREAGDSTPVVERDRFGNALGGVRTPALDVPIARYHPRMDGPGICELWGWRQPFTRAELLSLYTTHRAYVEKVRESVQRLRSERWITPADGARIVAAASAAPVP
jgi:hypothetical protein